MESVYPRGDEICTITYSVKVRESIIPIKMRDASKYQLNPKLLITERYYLEDGEIKKIIPWCVINGGGELYFKGDVLSLDSMIQIVKEIRDAKTAQYNMMFQEFEKLKDNK